MAEADRYFLGYRQAEQERLQRQAMELAVSRAGCSIRLVCGPVKNVIEIGCGRQGCLGLLAERVGPDGSGTLA